MYILKREMKRNSISFYLWTLSLAVYIFFVMSVFPTMAKNSANTEQYIKSMPPAMLKMFGLDKISMTTILGYFGTEAGIVLLLGAGIYCMLLGTGMLSKEDDDKTIEFLLSKPITRTQMITEKVLCYFIYIFLQNLILFVVSYFSFEKFKTEGYSLNTLMLLYIGFFLVEITFANIGLIASVFITKKKATTSLGMYFVIGMYFINMMAGLSKNLDFLKYVTPFKYADSVDIITKNSLNASYIVILLIVNIIAVSLTYIIYNRKNIGA